MALQINKARRVERCDWVSVSSIVMVVVELCASNQRAKRWIALGLGDENATFSTIIAACTHLCESREGFFAIMHSVKATKNIPLELEISVAET